MNWFAEATVTQANDLIQTAPIHEGEKWKWSRSVVSDSATPWTAAYQAPPSMGFSRQKYWSGVPLPSPKEESEKVGLKLNIQKTKIMASGPVTSWQIDGETVETVAHFILGGSKITADGDCTMKLKDVYSLERKL